jgi:hypothetical protein
MAIPFWASQNLLHSTTSTSKGRELVFISEVTLKDAQTYNKFVFTNRNFLLECRLRNRTLRKPLTLSGGKFYTVEFVKDQA